MNVSIVRDQLRHVPRTLLALIFLASGINKAVDGSTFYTYFSALWPVSLLPARLSWALQWSLTLSEIAIGILLFAGVGVRLVCGYCATLLLVFTLAVAPHYAEKECGCGWIANWLTPKGTLGFVARNTSVMLLSWWVGTRRKTDGARSLLLRASAVLTAFAAVVLFGVFTLSNPEVKESVVNALAAEVDRSAAPTADLLTPGESSPARIGAEQRSSSRIRVVPLEGEAETGGVLIIGLVKDLQGTPVSGAMIVDERHPRNALSMTDDSGRFLLTTNAAGQVLVGVKPGLSSVMGYPVTGPTSAREPIILMARSVRLAGRVHSTMGDPIEGARLWLSPRTAGVALEMKGIDTGRFTTVVAKSDDQGSFQLDDVPCAPDLFSLKVQAEGFSQAEHKLPLVDDRRIKIEMEPMTGIGELHGLVLHADGTVADGAAVCFGEYNRTVTDMWGRFRLQLSNQPSDLKLVAIKRGFQPGAVEFTVGMLERAELHEPILIVLGGPALKISGQVISTNGNPERGWLVGIINGLAISSTTLPQRFAEQFGNESGEHSSDSTGHFEVTGLRSSVYDLYVRHPDTGVMLFVGPTEAGTQGLVVEVPSGSILPLLTGRLRSRAGGLALGGSEIRASTGLMTATGFWDISEVGRTVTAEDGSFELRNVPRALVYLTISGDDVYTTLSTLEELSGEAPVEILAEARCRVELSVIDSKYDALQVADAAGDLWPIELPGGFSTSQLELKIGATLNVVFPESATTIILLRDGVVIDRQAVVVRAGEDNQLVL